MNFTTSQNRWLSIGYTSIIQSVGDGAESKNRLRLAGKDYISICEEALQQYGGEIGRETKALMYGKMGAVYYALGEKRKGLHFFLQAVRCNPFERENLLYPPRVTEGHATQPATSGHARRPKLTIRVGNDSG